MDRHEGSANRGKWNGLSTAVPRMGVARILSVDALFFPEKVDDLIFSCRTQNTP